MIFDDFGRYFIMLLATDGTMAGAHGTIKFCNPEWKPLHYAVSTGNKQHTWTVSSSFPKSRLASNGRLSLIHESASATSA